MSLLKVRSALVTAFTGGSFFPLNSVAWENVAFTPPTDEPWCSFNFVPSQPAIASIGPDGRDMQDGFLQLDLNYALGNGDKAPMQKYLDIKNVFTAGSRLSYQGQEVSIRSCGRSQGRVVDNFYRVSVTIYFYAQINR